MRAVDVIRRKRDGEELSREEIEAFAMAAAEGSWKDYQLSAMLMAIYLNGMSSGETAILTGAMANSDSHLCPSVANDVKARGGERGAPCRW